MKSISSSELRERIAMNDPSLVILDVRQPEEREVQKIDGDTLFIPLGELPHRIDELAEFKDKELIIYCRSGNRSGQACMFLEQQGFTHTVNLVGGMLKWS
ncbi:MAG TPA: rhodanese-like domain-containing protein [Candidatus Kapabacteria bacterium]|jgi:rhodanese-related sulfurtransferase|nr:rhodanese-like domain-containing protein [Ignavibacteria bacterium]HRE57070.1 rhodanese-like domain-containing protein [Candidatus Kapabacteria bacterium]